MYNDNLTLAHNELPFIYRRTQDLFARSILMSLWHRRRRNPIRLGWHVLRGRDGSVSAVGIHDHGRDGLHAHADAREQYFHGEYYGK